MTQVPPPPSPGQQPQYSPGQGFSNEAEQSRPAKAPTFLLVLCILTFVGSGWGFISAGIGLASNSLSDVEELQLAMEEMDGDMGELGPFGGWVTDSLDFAIAVSENHVIYYGGTLLLALMSLLGAFMMLKLRKAGFMLYTGGNILLSALPLLIIVNSVSMTSAVISLVFSLIFIVMYAFNLKHMR